MELFPFWCSLLIIIFNHHVLTEAVLWQWFLCFHVLWSALFQALGLLDVTHLQMKLNQDYYSFLSSVLSYVDQELIGRRLFNIFSLRSPSACSKRHNVKCSSIISQILNYEQKAQLYLDYFGAHIHFVTSIIVSVASKAKDELVDVFTCPLLRTA